MEKQTIVDTIKINYTEAGDGDRPALLLLHDWNGSSRHWTGLIAEFQKDYHVFAPDFPGFGKSEEPETVWSSAEYCLFTEHFLRTVKVKDPVVIAHGFGGRVGIMLAARGFAAKLILINSGGVKSHRLGGRHLKDDTSKATKKILSLPIFSVFQAENSTVQHDSESMMISPLMNAVFTAVENEDLQSYLARIKVPTLLIWGNKDTENPLTDGEKMEAILKQNQVDTALIVLRGFGHSVCFDAEKRFYLICKAFLEEEEV